MDKEATRWFRQAVYDLEAAKWNREGGYHENACFLAQQAVEKALKSVLYSTGKRKILTHSTFSLAKECAEHFNEFKGVSDSCADLDKHYIPARYPNGLPDNIPHDIYTVKDADESISQADKIITLIKNTLSDNDKSNTSDS
jgi:HEPN domain-containing protein